MKNLALLRSILYRLGTTEEEMSTEDRRAPGATRIPFEGLVEVGGAAGPTFEAQAVNVSEEGIQVRSAYLPEPGQQLTCRFDMGAGQSVLAAGEVAWARGADRGGELGIRFTDMDPESIDALKRACGTMGDAPAAAAPAGAKVRLHIDGLASPMRAKIRDSRTNEITVGSDLGFLQVGKELHLEDPHSGARRPASIDAVEVVVDPASHIPQLVVTLRYADVPPGAEGTPASAASEDARPAAPEGQRVGDLAAVEEASLKMRGAIARNAARIGPALERFASQAKTTITLLAKRGRDRVGGEGTSPRRTTAPAPGGGLHTSGRRVIRGEAGTPSAEGIAEPKFKVTKRKAAVASAVMIAAVLGAIVIKKTHGEGPPAAGAAAAASESVPASAVTAAVAAASQPPAPTFAPPGMPAASPSEPMAAFGSSLSSPGAQAAADDDADGSSRASHKKHIRVAPFGNGPVHHGTILHLKMDGPIEALEGAQQPTGFAVKIPGRKSLEAAGPLAARDSRIAAIKVSNESAGADLTVAFKDGVPNYQVSAHGDTLVITLATPGVLEKTVAKKDEAGGNGPKRSKPAHESAHERLNSYER
jgi:hypothetical protein